ncbi:nucleotidyltransferase [Kribbella qitaiheensis]|uniref:Nucleotidyltransferase n=1 Tax=Kribbella qitaiheensis TaxID=1544730 RepID=A0A7G6X7C2_9ACTN|nr:nucleotidyltransferase [Kribbella qitaiheensis]QNE22137.1 nucleotidyltransferase [Kribbella qitaiheensis]
MSDEAVQSLLGGFVSSIRAVLPVRAVWVHGSLALGDFVLGRSDFDLVAVLESPVVDPAPLTAVHRDLIKASPLAAKLHCTYVPVETLDDPSLRHPTFAQGRYFDRPVSPVARRELSLGDLSLFGPPPSELLPATTDLALAEFIRKDLRDFWYPTTAKRTRWYTDIWVDLGMVTVARAATTLRDGRLITKQAALRELPALGAPLDVVQDIVKRRYDGAGSSPWSPWRLRRGKQTRTYIRTTIDSLLA